MFLSLLLRTPRQGFLLPRLMSLMPLNFREIAPVYLFQEFIVFSLPRG